MPCNDDTERARQASGRPASRQPARFRDWNSDTFMDLLVHFDVDATGFAAGDTEACWTGELLDGTPFEGCDAVGGGCAAGEWAVGSGGWHRLGALRQISGVGPD